VEGDIAADSGSGSVPGSPGPRISGIKLLGLALLVVLLVQAAFVTSYVGALHDPKPRDLQVGVVGASPLPVALGKRVGFEVVPFANEAATRKAIDHRKIEAAFVSASSGSTLIVVPAAGPGMANALANAFQVAAATAQQKLAVVQAHPLPAGDASGATSFFVVMALIVGGYLAATITLIFGGAATRHRRLLALLGVSVVGALATDTIAGPVIGALPSSKFFVLWALFLLVMTAVAFSTAALQTLFGPIGTLIVVVLFVIFGAPAAGGSVPSAFLPAFWRVLGPYLPAGAGTTAVRNTVYFEGNAIGVSLLILAAYLLVGALVVIAIRRRATPASTAQGEAEAATAVGTAIV
jgi:hypothetical protein